MTNDNCYRCSFLVQHERSTKKDPGWLANGDALVADIKKLQSFVEKQMRHVPTYDHALTQCSLITLAHSFAVDLGAFSNLGDARTCLDADKDQATLYALLGAVGKLREFCQKASGAAVLSAEGDAEQMMLQCDVVETVETRMKPECLIDSLRLHAQDLVKAMQESMSKLTDALQGAGGGAWKSTLAAESSWDDLRNAGKVLDSLDGEKIQACNADLKKASDYPSVFLSFSAVQTALSLATRTPIPQSLGLRLDTLDL